MSVSLAYDIHMSSVIFENMDSVDLQEVCNMCTFAECSDLIGF